MSRAVIFPLALGLVEEPQAARDSHVEKQLTWQVDNAFDDVIIQHRLANSVVATLR